MNNANTATTANKGRAMTRFEQIEQRRRIDTLNDALAALKPADRKLITAADLNRYTLAAVTEAVETVASDLHTN